MSLKQALDHGGIAHRLKVNIHWIEAEDLEKGRTRRRSWARRTASSSPAASATAASRARSGPSQYARENKVPFFGICLGMQCATIEYARHVAGLKGANSTEFDAGRRRTRSSSSGASCKGIQDLGGTMRLGQYLCRLEKGSRAYEAYRAPEIYERHRHRFEFNPEYEKPLTEAGLLHLGQESRTTAWSSSSRSPDHPWFLGCQFHPEFKSRPLKPHPLFQAFIGASYAHRLKTRKH